MRYPNDSATPQFSVIVTCYFEERSIEEFYSRLSAAMKIIGRTYEIIMVNDGSTDQTFNKLKTLLSTNADIGCVIELYRNFGQAAAISAGLAQARGRAIIMIDSDLQLFPEDLSLLVAKFDDGYDVVTGYQRRKDSLFRKLVSYCGNIIMRLASGKNLRDFGCTIKIYPAALIKAFGFGKYCVFDQMRLLRAAGSVAEVEVRHLQRKYGRSGWTLRKLLTCNLDNMLSVVAEYFPFIIYFNLAAFLLVILRVGLDFAIPFKVLPNVSNGLLLNTLLASTSVIIILLSYCAELGRRIFKHIRREPVYIIKHKLISSTRI